MKSKFDDLIDRLQVCSEINHPNRPWSENTKKGICDAWRDSEIDLQKRVEKLESEIIKNFNNRP